MDIRFLLILLVLISPSFLLLRIPVTVRTYDTLSDVRILYWITPACVSTSTVSPAFLAKQGTTNRRLVGDLTI